MAEPEHDAVVLAGGTARRLGGADKPGLLVGERTLLDRVLDAVPGAERVIVVGPPRATSRTVEWCREEPPGGGPVAAIAAGLDLVRAPLVLVLAGDLPFLSPAVATSLLDAVGESDGAMLVDGNGRDQLLVCAWRTSALRSALPAEPAGARLASVVGGLHVTRVSASAAPGRPDPWFDCDTELDLATARGTT